MTIWTSTKTLACMHVVSTLTYKTGENESVSSWLWEVLRLSKVKEPKNSILSGKGYSTVIEIEVPFFDDSIKLHLLIISLISFSFSWITSKLSYRLTDLFPNQDIFSRLHFYCNNRAIRNSEIWKIRQKNKSLTGAISIDTLFQFSPVKR